MGIAIAANNGVENGPQQTIVIDGALTIYEAIESKKALIDALNSTLELEIDLSKVTEIDTAGMQLLVLLKREAQIANKPMRLAAHSQASVDMLDRFNLGGYFGDPVVISARESVRRPGE
jgi:ABC-type transporter Mla MlaB component